MTELRCPGGTLSYTRDELGYPAVVAQSLEQATYALGYLHARDRLIQVTLTGFAARGELMSVLGDTPLARLVDHSTRALGLARDLDQQVARCNPASQRLLQAYSAGFNAGVKAGGWPLLLRVLGVKPREFSAESVLEIFRFVTYFGLTSMAVSTELIIAELASRGAPRRVFDRLLGEHARGIDLDALQSLRLPKWISFFESALGGSPRAGSNAFAVAASRSSTGGALLMGEFHMEVGRFPPLFYAADLRCGEDGSLTGMTIPGCPWFAAGRTEHVGWSYTFGHADNVDFISEHVRAGEYLRAGRYHPLRRREERVSVRGKPGEIWVFHENELGTVLGDVSAEADLACVRLPGFDEAHRAFSAASRLLDCRSVEDLLEVEREIKSVSLEAILVDAHGDIASIVSGTLDRRPAGFTGAYPLVGANLAEGVPPSLPESVRPIAIRPEGGCLVSANQGGQGPNVARWCIFPEAPYRFQRITELLAARDQHDPSSLLAISYDSLDGGARRLLPVWRELLPDHPLAKRLVEWADAQADRELLRLYGRLYEEVCFLLLEQDLGRVMARRFREWSALATYQAQLDRLLALEQPELLDEATLRTLLAAAFPVALGSYAEHDVPVKLRFKNLVTRGKSPAWLGFDSAEVELPASPDAPFQCRMSPIAGEQVAYAPAFHVLIDMQQPGVFYNIPGGASESRFGPGYGKGVRDWLTGTVRPLGGSPRALLSLVTPKLER